MVIFTMLILQIREHGISIEIHQHNPLQRWIQRKKDRIISLITEKALDKIQHPFMLKVLERSGIQ